MPPVYIHDDPLTGRRLPLGSVRRAPQIKEQQYGAARLTGISPNFDPTKSVGLSQGTDLRPPVWFYFQDKIGSCTAASVCEAGHMCANHDGVTTPVLSIGRVYEDERRKENGSNWTADTGANIPDGLDDAIAIGLQADSITPYTADPATEYESAAGDADAAQHKWIASHQVFYPGSDALALLWTAFEAKLPVTMESEWFYAWFAPDAQGILPTGGDLRVAGGHAYVATDYVVLPNGRAVIVCTNHWSPQNATPWNAQCAGLGGAGRGGDFGMDVSWIQTPSAAIYELRIVTPATIVPTPQPDPARDFLIWLPQACQWMTAAHASGDHAGAKDEAETIANELDQWAAQL